MPNPSTCKYRLLLPAMLLTFGLALSACGGNSPAAPSQNNQSNDWDNMNWDQGSWS